MFTLMRGLPPDLLIVLDKSGSMSDVVGPDTKWNQVRAALDMTVMALQGQIKWGLQLFPTDSNCAAQQVAVPVAPNNYAAISSTMSSNSPGGNTPTRDAVHNGGMYVAGVADQNPKYLLLATDGAPNCGALPSCPPMPPCPASCLAVGGFCLPVPGNDGAAAVMAVQDVFNMGVHTFVVGIATGSQEDMVLNQMAMAGGEPRPGGPPSYYQVTSTASLVSVINMIAGQIISCTFPLQMRPPYPDRVTVSANGMMVPRDPTHVNGWDYGPGMMSIVFYGMWCQNLQNGTINDVRAIFGCQIGHGEGNDPPPN